eukprot:COSAG01_NODE_3919_length_5537_cov_3.626333_8_plen_39_part_00
MARLQAELERLMDEGLQQLTPDAVKRLMEQVMRCEGCR